MLDGSSSLAWLYESCFCTAANLDTKLNSVLDAIFITNLARIYHKYPALIHYYVDGDDIPGSQHDRGVLIHNLKHTQALYLLGK